MARRSAPKKKAAKGEAGENASRGAGRAIWSGSISFGLLQIPVSLHTAESRQESLHFHMLDRSDLAPVRFKRVSSTTGKPVAWKDIVKGFEEANISAREIAMAEQLIDGMMTEWDAAKYREAYYRDVRKIIDEKARKGEARERHAKVEGTVADDVVDLLDLLERSVGAGAANDARRPRRRRAKPARAKSSKRGKAAA